MKKQIIIAQRGWVFLGKVEQSGSNVIITDCFNVRRWGTTKGLGELATQGPTANTVLDPTGRVTLHELSIVARIDITTDKL
jgi:hypothetical protein